MIKMTRKEWLLLSRFVDGDLSAEQARRVEENLRSNADFKKTFERFVHTCQVLRSVPQSKIPHSFILSPEIAGIRERRRAPQRVWQFSSAMAAMVAVVALALQFFSPRASVISPVSDAAQPEMQVMAAPESADAAAEEPPIILWNPGAGGMGGGGAEGGESYPGTVVIPENTAPATELYGIGGGPPAEEAAPTEEMLAKALEISEAAPSDEAANLTQEEAVPEEETLSDALPAASNPILGIAPQEERGAIEVESVEEAVNEKDTERTFFRLSYSEVAISAACISIICAVVAFILHRKQH